MPLSIGGAIIFLVAARVILEHAREPLVQECISQALQIGIWELEPPALLQLGFPRGPELIGMHDKGPIGDGGGPQPIYFAAAYGPSCIAHQ